MSDVWAGNPLCNHLVLGLYVHAAVSSSVDEPLMATQLLSTLPSFYFQLNALGAKNAAAVVAKVFDIVPIETFVFATQRVQSELERCVDDIDAFLDMITQKIEMLIAPVSPRQTSTHLAVVDGDEITSPHTTQTHTTMYPFAIKAVGSDSLLGMLLRKVYLELTVNFETACAAFDSLPATISILQEAIKAANTLQHDMPLFCSELLDAMDVESAAPLPLEAGVRGSKAAFIDWLESLPQTHQNLLFKPFEHKKTVLCDVLCQNHGGHVCPYTVGDTRNPILLRFGAIARYEITHGTTTTAANTTPHTTTASPTKLRDDYLQALRDRDYQGAVDALHAYFDNGYGTAVAGGSPFSGSETPLQLITGHTSPSLYAQWGRVRELLLSVTSAPAVGGTALGRSLLHYPLLHLGATELFFGHINDARTLLFECLRAAQMNGDIAAVTLVTQLLAVTELGDGAPVDAASQLILYEQASRAAMWRLQLESAIVYIHARNIQSRLQMLDWVSLEPSVSYRHGGWCIGSTMAALEDMLKQDNKLSNSRLPSAKRRLGRVMAAVNSANVLSATANPTHAALSSASRRWRALADAARQQSLTDGRTQDAFSAAAMVGTAVAPASGSAMVWSPPMPLTEDEIHSMQAWSHQCRAYMWSARGYPLLCLASLDAAALAAQASGSAHGEERDGFARLLPSGYADFLANECSMEMQPEGLAVHPTVFARGCSFMPHPGASSPYPHIVQAEWSLVIWRIWQFANRGFSACGLLTPVPTRAKALLDDESKNLAASRLSTTMFECAKMALWRTLSGFGMDVVDFLTVENASIFESTPEAFFLHTHGLLAHIPHHPMSRAVWKMLCAKGTLALALKCLCTGALSSLVADAGLIAARDSIAHVHFDLLACIGEQQVQSEASRLLPSEILSALASEALLLLVELCRAVGAENADNVHQLAELHNKWHPVMLHAVKEEQQAFLLALVSPHSNSLSPISKAFLQRCHALAERGDNGTSKAVAILEGHTGSQPLPVIKLHEILQTSRGHLAMTAARLLGRPGITPQA